MKLISKKYIPYKGIVHDLTVENTHSYNVEGVAVHNSAAGSIVAYLTGITDVDPIEYDLLFERFQNAQKKSFPDIDSDFSNPGLVKEYIKTKYGEDKVASISNWSTLSPKVAVKDVARSLRLGGDKSTAFTIANSITAAMPDVPSIDEAIEISDDVKKWMKKYPELYQYTKKLESLTRNWSVHAAGVVIGDRPLYEMAPLRVDEKEGKVVTQWEKTRCEDNGLIKMDILGVQTLTTIDETFKLIEKTNNKKLTISDIDFSDEEVYKMIGRGETSGVFQLESSLTPLCMKIKPKNIEEISAINALGRPSCPPDQRAQYVARKLGKEKIVYKHKSLENAQRKTFGITLYEEQMMVIAKDCAGWDLNQADALRKITKLKGKDEDLLLKTEANFIADCMKHSSMKYEDARRIWQEEILPFSSYGFNKSLSSSELVSVIQSGYSSDGWVDIPIKDVKPGSLIRSRDESTGSDFITTVKENHYHGKLKVFKVVFENGAVVNCTINHKFRTEDGRMLPLYQILNETLKVVIYKSSNEACNLFKVISCDEIGEFDTYDLEIDDANHQYYLANGVLTSNSHSISYSFISYYTAWLRYHYPTEFMCAILNSEDPNGDKIQEYIDECRKMGILILSPDVNKSNSLNTVEKDKVITSGLSSVKGLGEKALNSIIANQPYSNFLDFLARNNSRVVGKTAIQSLAKSGAFDSFGMTRSDIHDNYQKYREKINSLLKKEIPNLSSMVIKDQDDEEIFEPDDLDDEDLQVKTKKDVELKPTYSPDISLKIMNLSKKIEIKSDIEEWDKKTLLLYEREVLGRTISGSIHDVFKGFFSGDSNVISLGSISRLESGSKVRVEGIIKNKIKEFKIKNGSNIGKKFAKYLIEDRYGNTCGMTLWADDYEKHRTALTDGIPFKAICKVNEYMDQKDLVLSTLERVYGR